MNITHTEAVEFRQRIAKLNIMRDDAQMEEMKLRRWLDGLAKKYNVQGLRDVQFNPDTGEIMVKPEKVHYTAYHSVFLAEKAADSKNIWNGAEELEGVLQ